MAAGGDAGSEAFVDVRCACGRGHTMLRDQVLDGLGVGRWRCGTCKRRFVIACAPGEEKGRESFFPVFLDEVPSKGETRQEGASIEIVPGSGLPAEMAFQCRCGCRLVARSHMYGRPLRCPRCPARMVLRPAPAPEDGRPIPGLEYLP